ncbi:MULTISPECIES: ADP-ribosylglycohydrolase family protein [Actinomycetes]|uniref:Uncharacterized protein n=2 Tax=Actinomycetes TaxID=1760 RepID=A0ABP6M1F1_9MICC
MSSDQSPSAQSPSTAGPAAADAAPSPDALLIRRLGPVLRAGLSAALAPDRETHLLHAEAAHQLCLADGLLELLDWTRQGVPADPLACLWLSSLRWHRLLTGAFPDGAPEPPRRPLDAGLAALLQEPHPRLRLQADTGGVSLAGLADGEMAYLSAPSQPSARDAAGLVRLVPLALVPYVEEQMLLSWAEQALALTQGHPEVLSAARELISLIRSIAQRPHMPEAERQAAVRRADDLMAGADDGARAVVRAQVAATAASMQQDKPMEQNKPMEQDKPVEQNSPEDSAARVGAASAPVLPQELEDVLRTSLLTDWEQVTAPA